MIISVNAPADTIRNGFREFARERITRTLTRLAHRITSVNVTLTDVNGPRGGVDSQCRVSVATSGLGLVTTSARHEDPQVAMRLATERARRMVLTNLKRPTALRVRQHRSATERTATRSNGVLQL